MSKGYEQFKRVDKELDALLLYLEKLEEDYARAMSDCEKNLNYKKGFEILHEYFSYIPQEQQDYVDKQLTKLEL
jgi:hypothetical protein